MTSGFKTEIITPPSCPIGVMVAHLFCNQKAGVRFLYGAWRIYEKATSV